MGDIGETVRKPLDCNGTGRSKGGCTHPAGVVAPPFGMLILAATLDSAGIGSDTASPAVGSASAGAAVATAAATGAEKEPALGSMFDAEW